MSRKMIFFILRLKPKSLFWVQFAIFFKYSVPTHKRYDSDDVSIASLHEREREYLVKIEGRGALCKRTGGHHDAVHTHTRLWLFSMRPFDNVLDRRLYLLSRDDFPYLRGLDTAAFSTRIRSTKYFFDSSFFSLYLLYTARNQLCYDAKSVTSHRYFE